MTYGQITIQVEIIFLYVEQFFVAGTIEKLFHNIKIFQRQIRLDHICGPVCWVSFKPKIRNPYCHSFAQGNAHDPEQCPTKHDGGVGIRVFFINSDI